MDKIQLSLCMSNKWTDPALAIIGLGIGSPIAYVLTTVSLGYFFGITLAVIFAALMPTVAWAWYTCSWLQDGPAPIDRFVDFKDDAVKKTWSGRRIPISTLCELYCDDKVAFKMDLLKVLRDHRDEFVNYKLTWETLKFLYLQLFPNDANSSMKHLQATKKEIAEHYDRGNDWFASFLGPRMVYTSAVFEGLDQPLEVAQDNKMSLICDKLMLQQGETMLDIGCGWGTLLRHAAKHYGVKSVGVTLSVEGAKYCKDAAKAEGLESKVDILTMDYREIPPDIKFNKVVSVEMAEHVGLKNFQIYLKSIKSMLADDGLFLLQVAGLRQGPDWQDIAWGIFMSRYIFPGADASTPLHWYIRQLETAGFEVRSVETIGRHYSHTLWRWYDNFQKNRVETEKSYGGYLCRLWDFFLSWSVVAAGQGSAACYQILVHKNTNSFNRDVFCQEKTAKLSVGLVNRGKA